MKKRIVGMLVVLVMICGILPANAASGIPPTEETWYVVSHSGDYRVYYYAAVTNNSGEPEKIKDRAGLVLPCQNDGGGSMITRSCAE